MYFDDFNKLAYDFKTGLDDSKELVFVKDITQNIRFRKEFLNSLLLYNSYTILDGETPEIISEKIYGSPMYHWTIMLANDRYDYIQDFPLDSNKLGIVIDNKYGDRKVDVHHFENLNGAFIQGYQILSIPNLYLEDYENYTYDNLTPGMVLKRTIKFNGVDDIYTGVIESIDADAEQITVLLTNGAFRIDDPVDIVTYTQDSSGIVETFILTFIVYETHYPYNIVPISNEEHEFKLNEAKRNIRLIPKAYLDQIMTEFSSLMAK